MRQGMLTSLASIHCNSVFVPFGTETFVMGYPKWFKPWSGKERTLLFYGR
jgi:hypothetical protein